MTHNNPLDVNSTLGDVVTLLSYPQLEVGEIWKEELWPFSPNWPPVGGQAFIFFCHFAHLYLQSIENSWNQGQNSKFKGLSLTNVNLVLKLILDERLLQKVSNHPVHILNSEGDFSPSAFIPFCIFGNNMINLGKKISSFELPVCNIFLEKIWNDQLCYEMNLNLFRDENDIKYKRD